MDRAKPLPSDEILAVVLREMVAYGRGWRLDWSDFDGRMLRTQLCDLADWARSRQAGDGCWVGDYRMGTCFMKEQGGND